jgi:hypothetical protein
MVSEALMSPRSVPAPFVTWGSFTTNTVLASPLATSLSTTTSFFRTTGIPESGSVLVLLETVVVVVVTDDVVLVVVDIVVPSMRW